MTGTPLRSTATTSMTTRPGTRSAGAWARVPAAAAASTAIRQRRRVMDTVYAVFKKILLGATVVVAALIATGAILYVNNTAPAVPPVSPVEAAQTGKPYVVKLHAQWCPVCMITKDAWTQIEKAYAQRVNLVVLDFTTDANVEASRAEA